MTNAGSLRFCVARPMTSTTIFSVFVQEYPMSNSTLDCSDLDNYIGKPMQPARMVDPFANNDIRCWVQAMHYPNRLHYDTTYAMQSRYGELIAPQSSPVTMDDGHGSAPSCIGLIPNSHMPFGGDEWWFYGPVIKGGDRIWNECVPFDYTVKNTGFSGPTCFQRGDNNYYNQHPRRSGCCEYGYVECRIS
jgi:N-terminal half of MaoC dehydratase